MDHFRSIYETRAGDYHKLITAEDVNGNLLRELERIAYFKHKHVLDLGSGTGRIPLMLHDIAPQIIAIDLHEAMLLEQIKQRDSVPNDWNLLQGDMCALPIQDQWADIAIAGWALGHFQSWFEDEWQKRVDSVIHEMSRTAKSNGHLIIIETLGTGSLKPAPPHAGLAEYYNRLEFKWGFERTEIRTDYQFDSIDDAVAKTEFFFGAELAEKILTNNWMRLPEWTGIWAKKRLDTDHNRLV